MIPYLEAGVGAGAQLVVVEAPRWRGGRGRRRQQPRAVQRHGQRVRAGVGGQAQREALLGVDLHRGLAEAREGRVLRALALGRLGRRLAGHVRAGPVGHALQPRGVRQLVVRVLGGLVAVGGRGRDLGHGAGPHQAARPRQRAPALVRVVSWRDVPVVVGAAPLSPPVVEPPLRGERAV